MPETVDTSLPTTPTTTTDPVDTSRPELPVSGDTGANRHSDENLEPGVGDELQGDAETFPREVVSALRKENATYRERARDAAARADSLAAELWHERVAATGLLADPADLPFDADALADPARIAAAAEELLAAKPHLRSRRITTRVGQGERNGTPPVSLLGMLRGGL